MRALEFQPIDPACCFAGGEVRELIDGIAWHAYVTRDGIQTRTEPTRAFARVPFLHPLRFTFCGKLISKNRFAVTVRDRLEILTPDFAEPAAFLARAMWRIK